MPAGPLDPGSEVAASSCVLAGKDHSLQDPQRRSEARVGAMSDVRCPIRALALRACVSVLACARACARSRTC
eukprot:7967672-Alexandrium_andersonii.AAC.1